MTAIDYIMPDKEDKDNPKNHVILVDLHDEPVGTAEKIFAHQQNLLHRAFSIFIFRQHHEYELLLQQRAAHKYHSAGLWTNTCCSHPYPGESIIEAANRRLQEEMGIHCMLKELGCFHYNVHFSNGLSENEIDHIVVGHIPASITLNVNPNEVQAYRWITLPALKKEIQHQPESFTPWLKLALDKLRI